MFGRYSNVRRRRLRRLRTAVVPALGAALLVGLLPAQSLALPPDPAVEEKGRETLDLETLAQDETVTGEVFERDLETLKVEVPEDLEQAPAGTATAPPADSGTVSFGSTVSTTQAAASASAGKGAATRTSTSAQQVDLTPVDDLPVSLGQAPDQAAPTGTWSVQVFDRASTVSQGVDGAVVKVQAPATGSVPISVKLDYAEFKNLYGADWASRLRFVQFPECYLTTPDVEACQEYEELETTNDTKTQSITATVDTAADGTVTPAAAAEVAESDGSSIAQAAFRTSTATPVAATGDTAVVGAVDSGGGPGGTFKATPLVSDGKWEAGGSSGAFTWSYPLSVPAAPAGPAPQVTLGYNSQTVDGRVAVSSPQASWIGEGWDYDPGHIERRYRSCQDDRKEMKSGTANNTAKKDKTSDLCWVSYNAQMSLGGRTVELVRDAPAGSDPESDTEVYRPQNDDGTRVERRTGGSNGDNNGEYWIVTTRDGTKYYFGLNQVGGGHADTDSVSTVPVFGNHPGEPCHATAFVDSRCGAGKKQAWRWGLDKVVDVHGNTMVVSWKQETNYYAVKKKFKNPEQYDRYAYPTVIEYGMRSDLTKPSATVEFGVKQRCLKSETACDPANFAKTDDPGAYRPWWDTPGNLNCKSTSKLCPAFPSFWTQMRLDTITTKAARAGQTGLGKVDTYELHQSFPEDWYDTSPGLWLNSITRRGFAPGDTTGTLQHKDGVSFAEYSVGSTSPLRTRLQDRQLPNLVHTGPNDQRPAFTRPRIGTVATEYGGDIEVEYKGGCATEPAEDKGRSNGTCYPLRWSPDGDEKTPAKAWFNKYVVHSVTETDKVTSHGKPVVTKYTYTGPAWAKNDDEFTRPSLRTYNQWRGYRQVAVTKGSKSTSQQGDPQSQSYSETRYFQGIGGEVKDSTGKYTLVADDAPQYAGQVAESIAYLDSDKRVQKRTLNYPWSKQTASRAREAENGTDMEPLLAHRGGIKRTDEIQTVDTSWQAVRTLTEVDDTYGLPVQIETAVVKPNGTGETLSNQTCTKTSYLHNTSAWLIGLTKEQRSTGTSCAAHDTADPATKLIRAVRNSYDNLAYGETPTKGLVTSAAGVDGAGTSYSLVTRTTYDPLGRVRTVTRPGAGTTETQYTPADAGGPVTSVKTINAKGHAVTTTFDPGRSLALTVTDANGRVTRQEYDALGRLVKGWSPSRSSGGRTPDVEIAYQPASATSAETKPAAVTTKTLKDDGTYRRQVTVYDGLMRQVQSQTEAHGPGRIITDISYNDHGLVDERTSAYLAKGEPATGLFEPRSKAAIPSWIKTRYDGMERPVRLSTYHDGDFAYATYTTYTDTTTFVNPPGASTPKTRTYTDALGRVSAIRHYVKDDGSTAGRTTTYEYDARGHRSKVVDAAGNSWSYTYDARGRMTSVTDPDMGRTETWYDDADRPNKVTDAKSRTTYTEYDELGRVKNVREGSSTATPAMSFTYDTLSGALGQPVASTRHTANGDYISRVTGYDTDYRPTGTETVIPSNAMTTGLAGTYAYSYTYTPTGKQQSVTLPAAGGLAKEKVVTRYNSDGFAESTSGLTWYTADVTYSPLGDILRTVSGAQPYRVWTTNFVDPHTGRLQRTVADRETSGPHRISDGYYSYDQSGSITSLARKLSDAAGSTWDNQCFTYDVMGELVNAWTSSVAPTGTGNGCKAANGTTWGHRTDYATSSGPVAEAADAASDTTSPDATLTSTLAAAAPDTATVATGATAYRQSFTFDWLGNRASMTEHDPADATKNVGYTYGYETTQPHTLRWISSTPSGKGSSYTYDAVGNTEVRDLSTTTQNLTWTYENQLGTITDDGTKTTYVYDAAGNRILENSPSGSTLYLGETEVTTGSAGTITRASRSYTQPGAPTVTRTTSNGATTGHQLSVLLADHLGTSNTSVALSSGQSVTRRVYKPYGEIRGTKPSAWPNKRGYLGVGVDDTATGLTHIGAREYDQNSGRFLSADPVIDVADPLQMNGYAYANNSPVSHSDPSGLFCDGCSVNNPDSVWADPSHGPGCTTSACYDHDGKFLYSTTTGGWEESQAASKAWTKSQTPKTNDLQELLKHFLMNSPNGDSPETDYWVTPVYENSGPGNACFGREACRQAYKYLLHHDDVGEAKRIAANYCVDNFNKCVADAKAFERGKLIEGFIGALVTGGRGGAAVAAEGRAAKGGGGARGLLAGCKCFLAGTDVLMADGTTKDIEDIELGDEVQALDPETGESGPRKVTRLIVTEADKFFNELSIATQDGVEKLTATHEHPFWSPSERDWTEAGDLTPGMTLLTDDGDTVIVTGNRAFTRHARTYNLTVDDLHTYYVLAGDTPVLVHNSSCPAISMDEAVSRAAAFVGGEGRVVVSGSGGFQFIRTSRDASGRRITQIARFDINLKSPHVQQYGPHLNLETQINGQTVRSGPLADPHIPIDMSTVRPGDIP
ncbi:polymorphic toxin-type HINT domain-containing protein [Streptomyces ipomoeae]|uniref:polymorphic toxin-type HINT domain-containing protein n=1 Tax=Streptomyces ipomoeae TaxID=103232 RepID=UPI0029A5052B|nr:polymorphic toxin-type HINT domain-containing protein [Streptomyces ipomoeae]MDX2822556.1 polymorphic toxin-type HINT domain-containing protein [Streptomyces ipomoeae]MDX2875531.1 polymorphic toxin-type HINT domain-containing protein [Streptomyces ipomoeae]